MKLTAHDTARLAKSERGAIKLRHGDDREMFAEAVRRAGGDLELARATKVGIGVIRHVMQGRTLATDEAAFAISKWLDTAPVKPLRRSAMSYCPSCGNTVPESHMRAQVAKYEWVELDQCKSCAMSLRIVSSKAKQSAGRT